MLEKAYELKKDMIIINRDLTELDIFVKDFLEVLKKHSNYLVVSGFVSISTGRTRGTEDVDILFPIMKSNEFKSMFKDINKHGFWCFQGDKPENVYKYIKNFTNVRFARKNEIFPNIELVPFDKTKKTKFFEFNHPQEIRVKDFNFKIPQIEFEILYKELVLKGKKDIEDAKHLRTFFSEIIKEENFKKYKPIILEEIR